MQDVPSALPWKKFNMKPGDGANLPRSQSEWTRLTGSHPNKMQFSDVFWIELHQPETKRFMGELPLQIIISMTSQCEFSIIYPDLSNSCILTHESYPP